MNYWMFLRIFVREVCILVVWAVNLLMGALKAVNVLVPLTAVWHANPFYRCTFIQAVFRNTDQYIVLSVSAKKKKST